MDSMGNKKNLSTCQVLLVPTTTKCVDLSITIGSWLERVSQEHLLESGRIYLYFLTNFYGMRE